MLKYMYFWVCGPATWFGALCAISVCRSRLPFHPDPTADRRDPSIQTWGIRARSCSRSTISDCLFPARLHEPRELPRGALSTEHT